MRDALKLLLPLAGMITLGACASTSAQPGFAPKPPSHYPAAFRTSERHPITTFTHANMPRLASLENYSAIEPSAGTAADDIANIEPEAGPGAGNNLIPEDGREIQAEALGARGCGQAVTFNKGALVAYQWDQSRLGLDTDSLAFGNEDREGEQFKLSYRLNLHKPKAAPGRICQKSAGQWQGLLTE